ncbi:MAG TPA: hypothetical protein VFK52_06750 [Nocardioidaceae bacterium]|nr:hypothetical protein [Nocardioidaceae bacterium]
MTEPAGELSGIPFTARLVVDRRVRRQLRNAAARIRLGHPVMLLLVSVGFLGAILAAALDRVGLALFMLFVPVVFIVVFVLPVLLASSSRVPVGSTLETGFGPYSFVVRTPNLTGELAYTAYRKARVYGDVVALFLAGSQAYALMPRALWPDAAVAAVNEGARAPRPEPPAGPEVVGASFVVPEGWAARAATAYLVTLHRRPRAWLVYIFVLAVGLVLWALLGSAWWLLYPVLGTPVVLVGSWLRSRRALASGLPVGSVVEVRCSDTAIEVNQPAGRTETPYASYTDIWVIRDFVLLRHRLGGSIGVFPREVFPEEALAAVQASVTGRMTS